MCKSHNRNEQIVLVKPWKCFPLWVNKIYRFEFCVKYDEKNRKIIDKNKKKQVFFCHIAVNKIYLSRFWAENELVFENEIVNFFAIFWIRKMLF